MVMVLNVDGVGDEGVDGVGGVGVDNVGVDGVDNKDESEQYQQ